MPSKSGLATPPRRHLMSAGGHEGCKRRCSGRLGQHPDSEGPGQLLGRVTGRVLCLSGPGGMCCVLTPPEMSVWELTSRYCFGSGKPELSRELLLDHRSEWEPLSVRKPSFSMARLWSGEGRLSNTPSMEGALGLSL